MLTGPSHMMHGVMGFVPNTEALVPKTADNGTPHTLHYLITCLFAALYCGAAPMLVAYWLGYAAFLFS